MLFLQAAIALGIILMLCLGIGLLVGIPVLVHIGISRNKEFDSYHFFQKLAYVLALAAGAGALIIGTIWGLFSLIDLTYT